MICELCYKPQRDPVGWQVLNQGTVQICPECTERTLLSNIKFEDWNTGMFSYGADPRMQQAVSVAQPPQQPGNTEILLKAAVLERACDLLADSLVREFVFSDNQKASPQMQADIKSHFLMTAMKTAEVQIEEAIQKAQLIPPVLEPPLDFAPEDLQDLANWGEHAR